MHGLNEQLEVGKANWMVLHVVQSVKRGACAVGMFGL